MFAVVYVVGDVSVLVILIVPVVSVSVVADVVSVCVVGVDVYVMV